MPINSSDTHTHAHTPKQQATLLLMDLLNRDLGPLAVSAVFAALAAKATYHFIPIAAPLFVHKGRVGRDLLKAHRPPM